jgi:hypothetical protein|tara:strand:- start:201 stop:335 length:135 start_codon:yes stop_codon:yes gene_type:complete
MNNIEPKSSIEMPTAKKVNPTRIGLRKLERIESPTVVGSDAVKR